MPRGYSLLLNVGYGQASGWLMWLAEGLRMLLDEPDKGTREHGASFSCICTLYSVLCLIYLIVRKPNANPPCLGRYYRPIAETSKPNLRSSTGSTNPRPSKTRHLDSSETIPATIVQSILPPAKRLTFCSVSTLVQSVQSCLAHGGSGISCSLFKAASCMAGAAFGFTPSATTGGYENCSHSVRMRMALAPEQALYGLSCVVTSGFKDSGIWLISSTSMMLESHNGSKTAISGAASSQSSISWRIADTA